MYFWSKKWILVFVGICFYAILACIICRMFPLKTKKMPRCLNSDEIVHFVEASVNFYQNKQYANEWFFSQSIDGLPAVCQSTNTSVLFTLFVLSSPGHWARRKIIRNTYGSERYRTMYNMSVLFIVGFDQNNNNISDSSSSSSAVMEEQRKYGDIIRAPFVEHYNTLAIKTRFAMRFFAHKCHFKSKFYVKLDDDVVVQPEKLWQLRHSLHAEHFSCRTFDKAFVERKPGHRWCVNYDEYSEAHFPKYCYGVAVIIPRATLQKFADALEQYTERQLTQPPIDDARMYGLAAYQAEIGHSSIRQHYFELQESILKLPPNRLNTTIFIHILGHVNVVKRMHKVFHQMMAAKNKLQ